MAPPQLGQSVEPAATGSEGALAAAAAGAATAGVGAIVGPVAMGAGVKVDGAIGGGV